MHSRVEYTRCKWNTKAVIHQCPQKVQLLNFNKESVNAKTNGMMSGNDPGTCEMIPIHLTFIRRKITRLKSNDVQTSATFPRTKTISDASTAISAPVPTLIPTCASASAGESLTPSPIIATTLMVAPNQQSTLSRVKTRLFVRHVT